jgi:hypothetical protein
MGQINFIKGSLVKPFHLDIINLARHKEEEEEHK